MRVSARRFGLVATIGVTALGLAAWQPAMARGNCGKRADIIKLLDGKYQEGRRAIGLISGQAVLEIYVSRAGTWTILASDTRGQSCVVSVGEGWESAVTTAALPGT